MALAVILTYPLVTVLDTHITGPGPGDHLAFLWNDWWARTVVGAGQWSRLFATDRLFAPLGAPLILNTHTALESLASATVLGTMPVVRAHNLLVLAGLAANGMAAYTLSFMQARRVSAALLAGTSFATCAFVTAHLLGHINLIHAWVLPLAALTWIRLVARPTPARAVVLAIAFAATLWSDYYYFVYATLFAFVWLIVSARDVAVAWRVARRPALARGLLAAAALAVGVAIAIAVSGGIVFALGPLHVSARNARNPTSIAGVLLLLWTVSRLRPIASPPARRLDWGPMLRHGAIAAVAFMLLTVPIWSAALTLVRSGDYVSQQYFWRSAPRGVDLATVVSGAPMHAVTGGLTRRLDERLGIDPVEQTGWLGVVVMVLLAMACRAVGTLGRDGTRWLWIFAVFGVWALGPSLNIGGLDTGVLLPQTLARYVPIVANARIPGRAFVVVQLAGAMIVALLIARREWSTGLAAVLTAAVVCESLALPYPLYRLPARDAIDVRLSRGTGAVIELPSGVRDGFGEYGRFDSRALAHQMVHGRPLVGGFAARVPPRIVARYRAIPAIASMFDRSAGEASLDALPANLGPALADAGISNVVVNMDGLSLSRNALAGKGLRFVVADGPRELYDVVR